MEFQILGPLRILDGGRELHVAGAIQRGLIAILALEAGRTVPTERLLGDLWAGEPPGKNALQARVSQVRKVLEAHGAQRVLIGRETGYVLDVDESQVDAARFESLTEEGQALLEIGEYDRAVDLLEEALGSWRGPALADFSSEPWALADIGRLTEMHRIAVTDRIEAMLRRGSHDDVIEDLEKLLADDPEDQRLTAQLMRALHAAGRPADALEVFRRVPSPLHAPSASRIDARPELPPRPTSFIGRSRELERIPGLLVENRLVTLTGPPGIGKTRLALEAADRLEELDGTHAFMIDLQPATDAAHIVRMISAALGIVEGGRIAHDRQDARGAARVDPLKRLMAFLERKELLLILDNCQGVIVDVGTVVGEIMFRAHRVRILATSTVPLQVAGEARWSLSSLSLPVKGQRLEPEELARYGAVGLFVDRASTADPSFTLDRANQDDVATICIALEGIPLALELAAARLASVSVDTLGRSLLDRLAGVGISDMTSLERDRVLGATISWAWERLSPEEKEFLARASVFSGGFTIEAAAAVCAPDGDASEMTSRLVALGLLGRDARPSTIRYSMIGALRHHAFEQLSGREEVSDAQERLVAFLVRLAEAADSRIKTGEQELWLDLLDAELENLGTALTWACELSDFRPALRLSGALGWFWWIRGHPEEARDRLTEVLDDPHDQPNALRARCLLARVHPGLDAPGDERAMQWCREAEGLYEVLGERVGRAHAQIFKRLVEFAPMEMESDVELGRAIATLKEEGDTWGAAFGHLVRATLRAAGRALRDAGSDAWEALALFTQLGDRYFGAQALGVLSFVAEREGDIDSGLALTEEALLRAERFGSRRGVVDLLVRKGSLTVMDGRAEEGLEVLASAAVLAREISFEPGLAMARNGTGLALRLSGDLDGSAAAHSDALGICERLGEAAGAASSITSLTLIAVAREDVDAARSLGTRALELARSTRDPRTVAQALEALAASAALGGEADRAGVLIGAASALRERSGTSRARTEMADVASLEARIQAGDGEERYEAGRSKGAAEPLGPLLDYAAFRSRGSTEAPLHGPLS